MITARYFMGGGEIAPPQKGSCGGESDHGNGLNDSPGISGPTAPHDELLVRTGRALADCLPDKDQDRFPRRRTIDRRPANSARKRRSSPELETVSSRISILNVSAYGGRPLPKTKPSLPGQGFPWVSPHTAPAPRGGGGGGRRPGRVGAMRRILRVPPPAGRGRAPSPVPTPRGDAHHGPLPG